jgi:hypothetical protein
MPGNQESSALPLDPDGRGFQFVYRLDTVNHCPACGRTHWHIGRFSAECGFCATALPLVELGNLGPAMHSRNKRPYTLVTRAA